MADMLMTMKRRAQNLQTVQNLPTTFNQIIGEVVSIPAGAAGELVQTRVDVAPILDADSIWYGGAGNSSLSLTSTAFISEVAASPDEKLTPGQYWVDYVSGVIRGRKADTSVSMLASYKTRIVKVGDITISGPVTIDDPVDVNVLTLPAITFASPQHVIVDSGAMGVTISGTPTVTISSGSVTLSGDSSVVGNVAAGAADSGNPVKMGAIYNFAKPTYMTGQRVNLEAESDGSLRVKLTEQPLAEDNDLLYGVYGTKDKPVIGTKYAYNRDMSFALEYFSISSASPANWRRTSGRIDSTTASGTYYWMTLDAVSLPANGSVTRLRNSLKIVHVSGTDSFFDIDNGDGCVPSTLGLVSVLSTTEFLLTSATTALTATTTFYKN